MPRRQNQHDLSPHVKVAIELYLSQRGGELLCTLNGVRNVPRCHVNLLSVNVLEEESWKCETRYPAIGPSQLLMWKDARAIVFEKKSRGYDRSRILILLFALSRPQRSPPTRCSYDTFGLYATEKHIVSHDKQGLRDGLSELNTDKEANVL
ncbi:Dihydroorotase [Phytophthora palmivora]|uniref:Dihydroorotase n=1 Tax=Phytophthora palmivora TaxID=4796 RepID=A0A2P4Y206_9STRA|nr:Dihydroorotase [Phytophthora palmivora]